MCRCYGDYDCYLPIGHTNCAFECDIIRSRVICVVIRLCVASCDRLKRHASTPACHPKWAITHTTCCKEHTSLGSKGCIVFERCAGVQHTTCHTVNQIEQQLLWLPWHVAATPSYCLTINVSLCQALAASPPAPLLFLSTSYLQLASSAVTLHLLPAHAFVHQLAIAS